MTALTTFAERLAGPDPVLSAWCSLAEPRLAGLLAGEDFDAVTLDMQHGAWDLAAVGRAIPLVAAAGKPAVVRIPVGDFATASRLLDFGAAAIIAPMINSAQDARRFADFVKYPPVGERSWGPHLGLPLSALSPDDYFRRANSFTVSLAMVETRESLAAVDDILAVPGIDGIFIGPSDLSIALSGGTAPDPDGPVVEEALDHVFRRARTAGKHIGIYVGTAERARVVLSRGYDFVTVGSDVGLLRSAARVTLAEARRAG